jgi:hypothetical protein
MNAWPTPTRDVPTERLEALRRWIEAGGHNAPEVAESVARRILARGDLRGDDRDDYTLPRGSPFGRNGFDRNLIH